jgi:hypothetical protein
MRAQVNAGHYKICMLGVLLVTLMDSGGLSGYSVLSHEEIVGPAVDGRGVRPLILQRYPNLSEAQIKEAHAYAYGGTIVNR